MKGQRYKAVESAGFILKLPQADQVVHPFRNRLDVSIEHCRIRTNTHTVERSDALEPAFTRHLVAGNQRTRSLGKDLCATSRATAHTGRRQLFDDPLQRLARDLRKEIKLHHRERLEMNVWKAVSKAL